MPSVLADFVGYLTVETADWEDPIEGRVLLSETQLVLAKDEDTKATISLDNVFDINPGSSPKFVDSLPGRPVTIAYQAGSDRATAVIAADETTSKKFETVMFKAILNGHPSQTPLEDWGKSARHRLSGRYHGSLGEHGHVRYRRRARENSTRCNRGLLSGETDGKRRGPSRAGG